MSIFEYDEKTEIRKIRNAEFAEGKRSGYASGERAGYASGEKAGYASGEKAGYASGEKTGYANGIIILGRKFGLNDDEIIMTIVKDTGLDEETAKHLCEKAASHQE